MGPGKSLNLCFPFYDKPLFSMNQYQNIKTIPRNNGVKSGCVYLRVCVKAGGRLKSTGGNSLPGKVRYEQRVSPDRYRLTICNKQNKLLGSRA